MADPTAPEPAPFAFSVARVVALPAALVVLGALIVGAIYLGERVALRARARLTEVAPGVGTARLLFYCDGLRTPPAVPAAGAPLRDDEEVVGVESGGKSRAYRLAAMNDKTRHIINDLVGGVPVTVTYCNAGSCTRGFGGQPGGAPLDVSQAGLYGGRMVVKVGAVEYMQDSGSILTADPGAAAIPFPYAEYPLTRTTWGQWKASHPHTDVFAGDEPAGVGN